MLEIHHIEDDHLRNAYDKLYQERPIRHTDSFYLWILKLVNPKAGQTLLDIACGQGRLVELAAAQGLLAYGSDISYQAVQAGQNHERHMCVCDGQALPFPDSSFDYITNIGSLEHYVDPYAGAREMRRILKPGGLACILLPNTFGIFNTVLYAFHTGRLADDGQPIQRYGTRYAWQELLENEGFSILQTHKYECEWPVVPGDWRKYLSHPKALVRLILTPMLPLNLANSFVYLCTPRR
jgi:ubiquinone/menaquinone biosynthesis C-methylase UbiE